jgi:alpha-L-rhamnosidase
VLPNNSSIARRTSTRCGFILAVRRLALLLWLGIFAAEATKVCAATGQIVPAGLRCEYQTNPLAVDAAQPRLSWRVESKARAQVQTAYQILAASSRELLLKKRGDLWDSGKVETNQTLGVVYQGPPLKSSQQVFWLVRVWDEAGQASAWSSPATWTMGLLSEQDWQAQWLNDGRTIPQTDAEFYREDPAPLFRREHAVGKSVRRARLHIAGLGYYEASLNGKRIGD